MRVFSILKSKLYKIYSIFKDLFFIVIGCFLTAVGTGSFLLPNQLSSGGFAGIATIIYYFYKINMATTIIALNIPLFVIGFLKLGPKFVLKTIFSTILYSIMIDYFEPNILIIEDKFLASIYGGIFIGIGLAFVLKANTSTGGTDLIAHIAQNYKINLKMSTIITLFDAIVIISNLLAFKNLEIGLYSVIAIYIIGKMIDIVFEGINFCKVIYIVSDKYEELVEIINMQIKRGATGLYGKGSYTHKNKMVIMCVSKRNDIEKIKMISKKIDPESFIIVTDAREVYGLGFK